MTFAIVRVRGTVNVNGKIADTMDMLHLQRPNHCAIVPGDESYTGMVKKVKDYVTYGEVDAGTLAELIRNRGLLTGDKPVTDAYVAEHTDFGDIQAFAEAVTRGDASLRDLPDFKPYFRLQPPQGGFEGKKRHFTIGGALGYRGGEINALIRRML